MHTHGARGWLKPGPSVSPAPHPPASGDTNVLISLNRSLISQLLPCQFQIRPPPDIHTFRPPSGM